MKKITLIIAVLCMIVQFGFAQSLTVTGVVTSKDDGQPVIGASIVVKGTSNGTITDFDGNYTITADKGQTLVVSYVGMKTQEVVIKSAMQNIILVTDAEVLEEVVVTAMGVVQEKKRLNFAVQNVGSDDLTEGKSANVLNALQGRVAGVNVTTGGGSPNSGTQLIIRGVTSLSQSNEPLIVLDGMPLTGGVGDLNPNDIESITVLKGAAASALYGQEAASGVLMITTKQVGAGKLLTTFNASVQFDTPANLIEVQQKYLPGSSGFYREQDRGGWGPMVMPGDPVYDNVRNFFNDFGLYHKYDFSLSGGSDKFQALSSVSFSNNDGIVPNDYLQKITALVKATYTPNKYIKAGVNANITYSKSRGAGSISSIYSWPINDDITNYKTESGDIRFLYFTEDKENSPYSPLWSRYMDEGANVSTRTILSGYITATPVKGFNLTARVSMDQNNYSYDGYTVPRFSDTDFVPDSQKSNDLETFLTHPYLTETQILSADQSSFGSYSNSSSLSRLLTANFNASYHIDFPREFALDVMLGAEIKQRTGLSNSITGRNFVMPGVYSISNLEQIHQSDVSVSHIKRRWAGVFGEIRADYKGLASLSVTGRWDWTSTLFYEYSPYFYPSVTGGVTLSELIPGMTDTKNDWFSYLKLRGNWAMVGKDAPAYLFDRRFGQYSTLPDGGFSYNPSFSTGFNLRPEMSTSWEVGLDIRFFAGRTRLDVAYYSIQTDNQIVQVRVPVTTGYVLQTRNEGSVKNHGVEISLEQDIIKNSNWSWTAALNFGLNRGVVVDLPDDLPYTQGIQYGDIFPVGYVGNSTTSLVGTDYLRTDDGRVICDENGYPQINPGKSLLIGNREPIFMSGLSTTVKYKGWTLSALFEGRLGGDVANVTGRGLWSNGMHPSVVHYRGRQVVWDGVVQTGTDADGNPIYEQNTTPIVLDAITISEKYGNVASNFLEDGSYIRLQYVTLGYDFSSLLKKVKGIEGIKLSFTGNNLFLITRYTGSDPQANASVGAAGTGSAGIDNYAVPATRSYNVSFQLTF